MLISWFAYLLLNTSLSVAQCIHGIESKPLQIMFSLCTLWHNICKSKDVLLILNTFFPLFTTFVSFLFYQHNVCQIWSSSDSQYLLSKWRLEDTFICCANFNGLGSCFQKDSEASSRYSGKEYQDHLMMFIYGGYGRRASMSNMYVPSLDQIF